MPVQAPRLSRADKRRCEYGLHKRTAADPRSLDNIIGHGRYILHLRYHWIGLLPGLLSMNMLPVDRHSFSNDGGEAGRMRDHVAIRVVFLPTDDQLANYVSHLFHLFVILDSFHSPFRGNLRINRDVSKDLPLLSRLVGPSGSIYLGERGDIPLHVGCRFTQSSKFDIYHQVEGLYFFELRRRAECQNNQDKSNIRGLAVSKKCSKTEGRQLILRLTPPAIRILLAFS